MSSKNDKIFQESIQLAICLLEGGNTEIQVAHLDLQRRQSSPGPDGRCAKIKQNQWIKTPVCLQNSFYKLMMGDNKSEKFFKVLHDRMKEAQMDIKATVSVNVGEMTHKANEKELEAGERV